MKRKGIRVDAHHFELEWDGSTPILVFFGPTKVVRIRMNRRWLPNYLAPALWKIIKTMRDEVDNMTEAMKEDG